jgi:N-acetylmuramoyl-L-alanine amidase
VPRRALVALLVLLLAGFLPGGSPAGRVAAAGAEWPVPPAGARVGVQAGHWRIEELPEDEARLRGQTGGSGGGYREVDVNLAVAQLTAAILVAHGVTVDLLPAAVPKGYQADAFVAIHCDASGDAGIGGYKLARYRASIIPSQDDALVGTLGAVYGEATGLRQDDNITRNMTGYYAYNAQRYQTTISRWTPSAIIELGYLTDASDRVFLVGQQDRLAEALAFGILRFLALNGRARPIVRDLGYLQP